MVRPFSHLPQQQNQFPTWYYRDKNSSTPFETAAMRKEIRFSDSHIINVYSQTVSKNDLLKQETKISSVIE